jgi:hypothetical protein
MFLQNLANTKNLNNTDWFEATYRLSHLISQQLLFSCYYLLFMLIQINLENSIILSFFLNLLFLLYWNLLWRQFLLLLLLLYDFSKLPKTSSNFWLHFQGLLSSFKEAIRSNFEFFFTIDKNTKYTKNIIFYFYCVVLWLKVAHHHHLHLDVLYRRLLQEDWHRIVVLEFKHVNPVNFDIKNCSGRLAEERVPR